MFYLNAHVLYAIILNSNGKRRKEAAYVVGDGFYGQRDLEVYPTSTFQ